MNPPSSLPVANVSNPPPSPPVTQSNLPTSDNNTNNIRQRFQPSINNTPHQPNQYQHFIPYSSFRESVKHSGIIIPRITEAANIALRYHESVISRPPGFGKTFIINILESLFLREKPLFERKSHYFKNPENGLIEFRNDQVGHETNNDRQFQNDVRELLKQWQWDDHSSLIVLRFDFSTIFYMSDDEESLHESIINLILRVAKKCNLLEVTQINDYIEKKKLKGKNGRKNFVHCEVVLDHFLTRIEKMNEDYVILIDDADYVMRLTEDYSNRTMINFFHAILKHSKKYQFLLATCVYPTSIPFVDISQNPDISAVFGFTLKDLCDLEILDLFLEKLKTSQAISRFSKQPFRSKSDLLNELEFLYGGYRFSPFSEYSVLNPISVIESIENFSFSSYWIEKVLPWREGTLQNDFLNYFTIFRKVSASLFRSLIGKMLKNPDEVDPQFRENFVILRYFGIFTFSGASNMIFKNGKTVQCSDVDWKIPNIHIFEYLSDVMVSYIQPSVLIAPRFNEESFLEVCTSLPESFKDKSLVFYLKIEYFDFFIASFFAAAGCGIRMHYSGQFSNITAESLNSYFLINIYKDSDLYLIADSSFKDRYHEGHKISKISTKNIFLFAFNFTMEQIQILFCIPDFEGCKNSNKMTAQYQSHSISLPDLSKISIDSKNLPGQDITHVNFKPNKKKIDLFNNTLDLSSGLNSSLIMFLNQRHNYASIRNRQSSDNL